MKLAILDLLSFPLGGDMTWLTNFRYGLDYQNTPSLEYTAFRFSRPGWSLLATKLPRRDIAECARVLNTYDVVLIPDINDVNDGADRAAIKAGEKPGWVRLLELLDVPVIVGIHGLCSLKNYSVSQLAKHARGFFMTNPSFTDGLEVEDAEKGVFPYLPYTRENLVPFEGDSVVLAGRLYTAKGHRRLAMMAHMIDHPVELWGSSSGTYGGVTEAQRLQDYLCRHGCTAASETPHRDEPWTVYNHDTKISYKGGYTDGIRPWQNARVAVDLTTIAPGHVEYVTLEALDAGARPVVLQSQWQEAYGDIIRPVVDDSDVLTSNVINCAFDARPVTLEERKYVLDMHDAGRYARQLYNWMEELV